MQDAVWLTLDQSLACRNADEILLLLKSSDRVAYDVDLAQLAFSAQHPASKSCAGACTSVLKRPQALGSLSAENRPAEREGGSRGDVPVRGSTGRREGGSATREFRGKATCKPGLLHSLALRRWHDLRPEREFRCFVRDHQLVGECHDKAMASTAALLCSCETQYSSVCTLPLMWVWPARLLRDCAASSCCPAFNPEKVHRVNPHQGSFQYWMKSA